MRALAGFAVLVFFGAIGAAFVVGLAGWKGSDPRRATGYYLGLFSGFLLIAALLGIVGSLAVLANPGVDSGREIPVPLRETPLPEVQGGRGEPASPGPGAGNSTVKPSPDPAVPASPGANIGEPGVEIAPAPDEPGTTPSPLEPRRPRQRGPRSEPAVYPPPPPRVPHRFGWDSRYSAGVGLVASVVMVLVGQWGLNLASNLADRNLFTGKAKQGPPGSEPGPAVSGPPPQGLPGFGPSPAGQQVPGGGPGSDPQETPGQGDHPGPGSTGT